MGDTVGDKVEVGDTVEGRMGHTVGDAVGNTVGDTMGVNWKTNGRQGSKVPGTMTGEGGGRRVKLGFHLPCF